MASNSHAAGTCQTVHNELQVQQLATGVSTPSQQHRLQLSLTHVYAFKPGSHVVLPDSTWMQCMEIPEPCLRLDRLCFLHSSA